MKKSILILAFLAGCISSVLAQQQKAQLRLIGAAMGDSIVLRWTVANQAGWMPALVSGFLLERTVLDANNKVVGKAAQAVTKDTIHPWPYASLETRINRNDTFALLAAQCLYGKTMRHTQPSDNLIQALQEAGDEADNRFGYAQMAADFSEQAANLLGLRWVDKGLKKGHKYVYTLRCAALDGKVWSDTTLCVVDPAAFSPLQALPAPTIVPDDHAIGIKWKKEPFLSGYFVERSEDGTHFQRLNQTPFMDWTPRDRAVSDSLTWIDSVGSNYKPYYYRVSGINPFAAHTPPSAAAKGFAIDRVPPIAISEINIENTSEGVIKLRWKNPPQQEPLMGLVIARTSDPTMPYTWLNKQLLPISTTEYTDEKAWQYGSNYYAVGLVDTAGNIGWSPETSAEMKDFAPPVQPTGLTGSIDTSGTVRLRWNLGPDFDLKGYQVYAANQADHAFIPVAATLIEDTVFQYNINLINLTEHIYYRVKAFDKHLKESAFSEMLELAKPDIIPPSAPVFDDYRVNSNGVYLHWRPSSAKDLSSQRLLRRAPKTPWETISVLPKDAAAFTDTMLRSGQVWDYAVQSIDDAGLQSEPSFPITVKIPPAPKKQGLAKLRGIWDDQQKRILLEWELVPPTCTRILVYRSYNDGGLEMLRMLEQNTIKFEDTRAMQPGTYAYALKPIYADGSEGPLTELVTIHKP